MKGLVILTLVLFGASSHASDLVKRVGYLTKSEEKNFIDHTMQYQISSPLEILSGVRKALKNKGPITIIDTTFSDNQRFAVAISTKKKRPTFLQIELENASQDIISKVESIVRRSAWVHSRERVRQFRNELTQTIYSGKKYTLKINLTQDGRPLDVAQAELVNDFINSIARANVEEKFLATVESEKETTVNTAGQS